MNCTPKVGQKNFWGALHIATVSFPLRSAIQRKTKDNDVPVNVSVNLTETQQEVLGLIKENQNITHREIAERLSITDKTAKRATMALRECSPSIRYDHSRWK
ncbi:MAG: winged helix-turn-helix domain-containing protein [Bacteroides sp.]|nr:winged helix-turn-helix domain-containing protein [Bacteroides sp.]